LDCNTQWSHWHASTNTIKERVNSCVLKRLFIQGVQRPKNPRKPPRNAFSDALLMSRFQNFEKKSAFIHYRIISRPNILRSRLLHWPFPYIFLASFAVCLSSISFSCHLCFTDLALYHMCLFLHKPGQQWGWCTSFYLLLADMTCMFRRSNSYNIVVYSSSTEWNYEFCVCFQRNPGPRKCEYTYDHSEPADLNYRSTFVPPIPYKGCRRGPILGTYSEDFLLLINIFHIIYFCSSLHVSIMNKHTQYVLSTFWSTDAIVQSYGRALYVATWLVVTIWS